MTLPSSGSTPSRHTIWTPSSACCWRSPTRPLWMQVGHLGCCRGPVPEFLLLFLKTSLFASKKHRVFITKHPKWTVLRRERSPGLGPTGWRGVGLRQLRFHNCTPEVSWTCPVAPVSSLPIAWLILEARAGHQCQAEQEEGSGPRTLTLHSPLLGCA